MKFCAYGLLGLLVIAMPAFAASDAIRIELNAAESAQGRCRLSFVIENKGKQNIDTLKLDLVVFNRDGVIDKRLIAELGPLRGAKTVVKAFDVGGDCGRIGSILMNEVNACTASETNACLDRLILASRVPQIRFFK